jgi:hypothetical protein
VVARVLSPARRKAVFDSPLLANIYMNRFLKYGRLTNCGEAFRAHVVSYADDFIILERARDFLVRRHKVAGRGTRQFSCDVSMENWVCYV